MNPDPWQMAAQRDALAREERIARERRARLHNAAVLRRKKRKRGGKK